MATFSYYATAVAVAAGVLGHLNPVDLIARGKFVRALQTLDGEGSATVCLPASTDG